MFLESSKENIRKQYEDFSKELPVISRQINSYMESLSEEEALGLKYLYVNMPLSDVGNYSVDVYLDYVRHGLYLWKHSAFVKEMPEEIFRNYVLYHRVNEEEIKPCRSLFWEQLKERVANLSMKDAILEVNYWCAEEAVYQSTDTRTSSALDVYLCGFGRCGEESVFAINALRSAGIPARQVYAPRWAHCDDNHAWVEVWCEGEWHYLGACEPEIELDQGWFNNAASRAMMVSSRWFEREEPANDMAGAKEAIAVEDVTKAKEAIAMEDKTEAKEIFESEEVIGKEGINLMLNQLSRYTNTKRITIQVTDKDGMPVSGVNVTAEVLNYAEFAPVAGMITDQKGIVSLTTGLGSLHISAAGKESYGECLIDTRQGDYFACVVDEKDVLREGWSDFEMIAPKDCWSEFSARRGSECIYKEKGEETGADKTKIAERRKPYSSNDRNRNSSNDRKRDATYSQADQSYALESESTHNKRLACAREKCRQKREKFQPVWREQFAVSFPSMELQTIEKWMAVLSEKDRRDVSPKVLREHFEEASVYQKNFPEELFLPYVWNPRVEDEVLAGWRREILHFFLEEQKGAFRKDPRDIWKWIQKNIVENEDRERLSIYTTPAAALRMGTAGINSQKVLFVAIARTLGIPARLDEQDLEMEFWNGRCFERVTETAKKKAHLTISGAEDTVWNYFGNWSIARKTEGGYVSLKLSGQMKGQEKLELDVEPGQYRILTANRAPSGNVFAKRYDFHIAKDERKNIVLEMRDVKLKDMLSVYEIPDFALYGRDSETGAEQMQNPAASVENVTIRELTQTGRRILFWLEVGKEPTEHILNELMEHQAEYKPFQNAVIFLVKHEEAFSDGTLKKCRAMFPDIRVYFDSFGKDREMTARKMYVDPEKLPLMVVTDGACRGIFAAAGYAVGMAELLLRILKSE